jgi:hypothetical protein
MITTSTRLSKIWNSLGDFWGPFEDKQTVENWWESSTSLVADLYQKSYWIHYSKSIKYLSPVISGIDHNFNLYWGDTLSSLSGLLNMDSEGAANPELGVIVDIPANGSSSMGYVDEDNPFSTEGLSENNQWSFSTDKQYMVFPAPDDDLIINANQTNINYTTIYLSGISILNPFLFDYWGKVADVDIDLYLDEDYDHNIFLINNTVIEDAFAYPVFYKYFIWAMIYLRKQAYSLDVLENLIGIGYGVPFSFESGVVYSVTEGQDPTEPGFIKISGQAWDTITYTIPFRYNGSYAVSVGETTAPFQLLLSGIYLDDYITDSGLINDYANSGITGYSTMVLTKACHASGLSYNEAFISGLIEDVVPQGINLHYRII